MKTRFVEIGLFNKILVLSLMFFLMLFWVTDIDIRALYLFYTESGTFTGPDNRYFAFLYYPMNAIIFTTTLMIGFPLFIMSLSPRPFFERFRLYRNHALLLITAPLLGAGLFNSIFLKALFARPRPHSYLSEAIFYRPFHIASDHWGQLDMSFPSGHVAMAFVLCSFYFAFGYAPKLWQKMLKWGVGVVMTLVIGILMIVSRVAYGHHYLSDGVFGAAFTYGFVLMMHRVLRIPEKNALIEARSETEPAGTVGLVEISIIVISIFIPVLLVAYMMRAFDGLTSV